MGALPSSEDIEARRLAALDLLRSEGSVLVALSGGVDSAVLLALAIEALGPERVLAVTARSPAVPAADIEDACRVARHLGAPHEVVETREIEKPEYRANAGDRCFHCRTELFSTLQGIAYRRSIGTVVYGAIPDDLRDTRPGMEAARRFGVRAPLLEAGLDKAAVRTLASKAGLPVRDKPASACLASRIPIGVEVTRERLSQIERAETALKEAGFRQVRVRHHGEIARLELDEEGIESLLEPRLRRRVVESVRAAGFRFVAVDLEGYRQGSMNPEPFGRQSLPPAGKPRP